MLRVSVKYRRRLHLCQVRRLGRSWERLVLSNVPLSNVPHSNVLLLITRDEALDGKEGVLGYAYISVVVPNRQTSDGARGTVVQPVVGEMRYDTADIQRLMDLGIFGDVVEHEIGHILGIGVLWDSNGLLDTSTGFYKDRVGVYETRAAKEWKALGCEGGLPVETDFGSGTRFGHWDEGKLAANNKSFLRLSRWTATPIHNVVLLLLGRLFTRRNYDWLCRARCHPNLRESPLVRWRTWATSWITVRLTNFPAKIWAHAVDIAAVEPDDARAI